LLARARGHPSPPARRAASRAPPEPPRRTNPVDYKFYGICVSACPSAGAVVCNYDTAALPFSEASQSNLLNCLTGANGAPVPTKSSSVTCASVKTNCWANPILTSSMVFRCARTRVPLQTLAF
jgi:hypothetical protein